MTNLGETEQQSVTEHTCVVTETADYVRVCCFSNKTVISMICDISKLAIEWCSLMIVSQGDAGRLIRWRNTVRKTCV